MHSIHSFFNKILNRKEDNGIELISIDETDSTNSLIKEMVADGKDTTLADKRILVVTADYQKAGKGQGTNTWESERNKNLLFSILVHPVMVPVRSQFLLSMMEAVALKEALNQYVKDGITLKWPNDIYWNDKKISGTLIETTLSGGHIKDCIFGTGLNVNQTTFRSSAPNPISLCQILGHEVDRKQLLNDVVQSFEKWYQLLINGDYTDIAAFYHDALYWKSGFHLFKDEKGTFEGAIVEVEDDGHLILRDHEGCIRRYAFKEVAFQV